MITPRRLEIVHDAEELREGLLAAVVTCAVEGFRAQHVTAYGIDHIDFDAVNSQLAADIASYDPRLAGMRWRVHRSGDSMDLLVVDRQEVELDDELPRAGVTD